MAFVRSNASPACDDRRPSGGFSLLELLVTMAVLSIFVVLLFSVTDSSFKLWRQTASNVAMFESARAAYDIMTRRLSQATLNTYLDYYDANWQRRLTGNTAFVPARYGRASDLAFYSGDAGDVLGGSQQGHGVFFFAPLGYTAGTPAFADLPNLLNAVGYYVEWGSDADLRPGFLSSLPARHRFRLIERIQPSQNFSLYPTFTDSSSVNDDSGQWVPQSVGQNNALKNILAENVIALVIRPELSAEDAKLLFGPSASPSDLTADYVYDSRAGEQRTTTPEDLQFAQLPPMLRVVMVAVGEKDAARVTGADTTPPAALRLDENLFTDPDKLDEDLAALSAQLTNAQVPFRIFNSVIPVRGAKFSARKET